MYDIILVHLQNFAGNSEFCQVRLSLAKKINLNLRWFKLALMWVRNPQKMSRNFARQRAPKSAPLGLSAQLRCIHARGNPQLYLRRSEITKTLICPTSSFSRDKNKRFHKKIRISLLVLSWRETMTNMVIEASSSAEGRFLTQMLRAVCRVMVRYSTESIQHPRKRIIVREGRMVDFVLI